MTKHKKVTEPNAIARNTSKLFLLSMMIVGLIGGATGDAAFTLKKAIAYR